MVYLVYRENCRVACHAAVEECFPVRKLNQAGFFKRFIGSFLVKCLDAFCGEVDRHTFLKFWHVHFLLLNISVAAAFSCGVKLRSTRTV